MYLEKLEVQGFKSFANKNVLIFPGMLEKDRRGITAVVGPNGSGKSNIADAVRWVLGEQSMKTLRGKKSEDVIFSGSDKKGKLGMAEVSLFLNNQDGQVPSAEFGLSLDNYSQIVLTRRLYRDGDSEYLLNGSRARLSDIQILLAKAKFGQKTYSVIGQGMVEGFLNTSLAERKEFFDEATGVKQFQIKRDESLNKLKLSYENLSQAQMLVSEIEPRLKSLTRQVHKLQKREMIEAELKEMQIMYFSKNWHEINDNFNKYNKEFLEIEKIKIDKEKKLAALNLKLRELETASASSREFSNLQKELSVFQGQKELVTKELVKIDAQIEVKMEANGQFDLSWLTGKKTEISKELAEAREEIKLLEKEIIQENEKIKGLMDKKDDIKKEISLLNDKIFTLGSDTDDEKIKKIGVLIRGLLIKLGQAEAEGELSKIKEIIGEIKTELGKMLEISDNLKSKSAEMLEKTRDKLNELGYFQEEISVKINENGLTLSKKSERKKLLAEKENKLINDLRDIENKLSKYENNFGASEAAEEQKKLKNKINEIDEKILAVKNKSGEFGEEEEKKRSSLFELQRNIQTLQNEANNLNNQLNDLKINSTRYETRLEDLEAEARHALGDLKEVKNNKPAEHLDLDMTREKIDGLKKQLDLIGGIDPEIEKEYIETKERFDFLSGQINDLEGAINSLEKIIKELDMTIKERFDKEFKIISQKFEEYFKILFNGGNAKIIKVMAAEELEPAEKAEKENNPDAAPEEASAGKKKEEDINYRKIKFLQKHNATGLAGVEIQATPPGKKIKTISMLSGGERALTAIALICAIISANPSPFVVLDEVDAALDEANSERLAKILDDLSHRTQFIIITHNRASMRRANILYGVTMQDDGVSKLLSIKLDEAEAKISN